MFKYEDETKVTVPVSYISAIECPTCGIIFCIPKTYYEQRAKDYKSFYCPNGHILTRTKENN